MGLLKYYLKGSSGGMGLLWKDYYIIMEGYYGWVGLLLWGGLLWLGAAATHNIITHNCYNTLPTITFYTPITELLYGKYKNPRRLNRGNCYQLSLCDKFGKPIFCNIIRNTIPNVTHYLI